MLQTKGNISTGSPSCKSFPVHQCTCSASHCCSRLRLLATLGAIAGAVGGPNFWRRPKALIRSHHGTFTRISSFNLQFCYGQKTLPTSNFRPACCCTIEWKIASLLLMLRHGCHIRGDPWFCQHNRFVKKLP
jgi:hypothetical protein